MQTFRRTIFGREFVIETQPISADRWRAHLVRQPGVPTATMPFYGKTGEEAAENLILWLTLVNRNSLADAAVPADSR